MKKKLSSMPSFVPTMISMLLWIGILVFFWEMGARKMDLTKRTPENILPHLKNIWEAIISNKRWQAVKLHFRLYFQVRE